MARITVAHHPELTPESALEVFRRHLNDRYDVRAPSGFEKWLSGRPHLVVRKTQWAAVALWLGQNQKKNTTFFRFSGIYPPIALLGALFAMAGILITYLSAWLLLRGSWKAIEADIALVIESASEFK